MRVNEEAVCRVCKGNLKVSLDLGEIYPSSFLKKDVVLSEEDKVPLVLAECENCGLVQLKHTVDLDSMYRQYWYASSLNKSMVSSLKDIAKQVEETINLGHDTVVDIGCNDGTLFKQYTSPYVVKIGFDPSLNIGKSARDACDIFVNDYFSAENFPLKAKKAKVITAIAMYYDIPDPIKFTKDIKSILHEDGIFVVQFTDLVSMFKITAYDNICLEHLEYYRLKDIKYILEQCGLEIIDVSYNNVNGGSLRVIASHLGRYHPSENVKLSLESETEYLSSYTIKDFSRKIKEVNYKIKKALHLAKELKHRTYALGASTKGNTLLQLCRITKEQIPYVAEVNKEKFGLKTAGTDIDIISDEQALSDNPDVFLVLPWHFADFFISKYSDYLQKGGTFLVPLPEPRIITKYGTIYI